MSDFQKAFDILIYFEGPQFTDDPDDPGGPTKYGITIGYLQEYLDARRAEEVATVEDIRNMSLKRSRIIYRDRAWDKFGYAEIHAQEPATSILLATVHLGPWRSHCAAQWACRCIGDSVVVDGLLGPISMGAINAAPTGEYSAALRSEIAGIERCIVKRYPYKSKYLSGWLNRAYWPR